VMSETTLAPYVKFLVGVSRRKKNGMETVK
jgi:hypothetical protein